jgi:hypothetical protein
MKKTPLTATRLTGVPTAMKTIEAKHRISL